MLNNVQFHPLFHPPTLGTLRRVVFPVALAGQDQLLARGTCHSVSPAHPGHAKTCPLPLGSASFSHMESFSVTFRICTPCTSEAPPRMAQETCTASVISSTFDPFSRHAWV